MTSPMHSPLQSPLQPVMRSPLEFRRRGGFNPLSLFSSGQEGVWYDPSDLSTMWQDAAGTTPVTAAGQPVGLILDKSGRGHHASQSVSDDRPILQIDGLGNYKIVCNGTNQCLEASYAQSSYPLFVCAGAFLPSSGNGAISLSTGGYIYKNLWGYGDSSQYAINDRNESQNATSESCGWTSSAPDVISARFDASSINLIANGIDGTAAISNSNTFGSITKLYIGKTVSNAMFAYIEMYGLIVRAAPLVTLSEQKTIEKYLQIKSGDYFDVLNGYIAEGDSITSGYYGTGQVGYAQKVMDSVSPRFGNKLTSAVSGSYIANVSGRISAVQAKINAMLAIGVHPIVSLLIGTNDKPATVPAAQTLYDEITTYCDTIQGYGASFILCTAPAIDPAMGVAYEAVGRPELNRLIRQNDCGADAVCDFAGDAGLNVWNGTYYYDGLHPNDAGHTLMQEIFSPVIATVRKSKAS